MKSLSKSPASFKQAINATLDLTPPGPEAMDRYRMSYISGARSSISPRNNYQIEDAIARVRAAIKKEKSADKRKHDRMLDTARLRKARTTNIQTRVDEAKSAKVKVALKK